MTEETRKADLLVRAPAVVTMNAEREILRDGAVAVSGGRIAAVGKASELVPAFDAARVIEVPGGVLTPGLIDAHNHPHDYFLRGVIDDIGDLATRISTYVSPYDQSLTHDEAYQAARASFAEMLLHGTTCVCDAGGPHPDAIGQALLDSGIRGTVAQEAADLPGPFAYKVLGDVETIAAVAAEAVERWDGAAGGRIRGWFSIVHPGLVTDELCAAVLEQALARDAGIVGHFHGYRRPDSPPRNPELERYERLGVLYPGLLLAHINWISDADVAAFARHDVKAVHCPAQSMFGGSGAIAHGVIPELVDAGVPVALGTDAACVSRFLDLVRVMHLAAVAHRDVRMDPLVIGAHKAFEMATVDGAAALRWDDEIGSLEPGKRADMAIFETDGFEWLPHRLANPVADLVYTASGRSAHTVVVDGEVVVDAGRLVSLDADVVAQEADAAASSVLDRLGFGSRPKWPVR